MAVRVLKTLAIVVAIALVARVMWGLLGPLLSSLGVALVISILLLLVVRGPHARKR